MGVSFVVGAVMGASVGSTFATVDSRVKTLRGSMKNLQAVSQKSAALVTAESTLQAARAAYAADANTTTGTALKDAEKGLARAEKQAKRYNITVAGAAKAHADATAAIKQQTTALATMEKLQANKAKRSELKGEMVGTVAGFLAAGAPLKLAADYETAMAKVKRSAGFNAEDFAAFKKQALALGGSLEETGIIAKIGGSAVAQDELLHFTAVGKKMTKVFEISAEEAGEALGGLRTHFKLTEAQTDRYLDTLSHLANNMHGASGSALVEYAHRTADAGKQYGVGREQIAALGAAMSALQIPAKQGVSATLGIFESLGQAKGASKDAQKAFARMGMSGKQIQASFRKDAQGTMLAVFEKLQTSFSGPMRAQMAKAIFGSDAVNVIKMVEGLDQYKKAIALAGDSTGSAGSFLADYSEATNTANAALGRLKNKVVQIGTAMGESNLPVVKWIAAAGGGMLDTVFALVTGFPMVTSTVVGLSTSMVGLSLAAKAGKYAGTRFSDGWLVAKGALNALRPSVIANRAAIVRQTADTVVSRTVSLACAAGAKALTVAQWALNSAMLANPITWIVVGVAALVAGMVLLYQKSETVRKIVGTIFAPLATAWEVAKGVLAPVGDFFAGVWDDIVDTAKAPFEWLASKFAWISEAAGGVKGVFSSVGSFFGGEEPAVKPMPVAAAAPPSARAARSGAQIQGGAAPVPRPAPGTSGGSGSLAPQITFSINFSGVPSKDVGETLVGAIKAKERELSAYFEKMIASIASNQRRLAYDR